MQIKDVSNNVDLLWDELSQSWQDNMSKKYQISVLESLNSLLLSMQESCNQLIIASEEALSRINEIDEQI